MRTSTLRKDRCSMYVTKCSFGSSGDLLGRSLIVFCEFWVLSLGIMCVQCSSASLLLVNYRLIKNIEILALCSGI